MATFSAILKAASVARSVLSVCKEVHDYIIQVDRNIDYCESIQSIVADLENSAHELKKLEDDKLSENCKIVLGKLRDALDNSRATCKSLQKQDSIRQLLNVRANRKDLERLKCELKTACDSIQFALQIAALTQNKEVKETVQQERESILRMLLNQDLGFFQNPDGHTDIPDKVERPRILLEQSLMVIKWVDRENDIGKISRYEVWYDDETKIIRKCEPQNLHSVPAPRGTEFTLKLGEPVVCPGKKYNVKIRAVNGAGPGEWSEAFLIRFLKGRPAKPPKPSLALQSATEVKVKVKVLTKEEEHGSPITHCRVEYTADDENSTSMSSKKFSIKNQSEVEHWDFTISSLQPRTIYHFRVVMINGEGESDPSSRRAISTECLVPGSPQNVRISSKRTSSVIKVRWNEPNDNPKGVCKYRVEYRKSNETEWSTSATIREKEFSQKVKNLKTDTIYQFRVRSMNENDDGTYSERIEGETRYGTFGCAVATTAAFFGGIVGGPVIGATGLGYVAATSAKEGPDSKTGKKAAAVAAGVAAGVGGAVLGTVGAPIVGLSSAMLANKTLQGKMEDISPQTSDDEDKPKPSFMDMIMKQSKDTAEAMVENESNPKKGK